MIEQFFARVNPMIDAEIDLFFLRISDHLGSIVERHGLVPGNHFLRKFFHNFWMLWSEVVLFAPVGGQIIKECIRSIIFAEQFPFSRSDGEIGQILDSVEGITIGRASKENILLSGSI